MDIILLVLIIISIAVGILCLLQLINFKQKANTPNEHVLQKLEDQNSRLRMELQSGVQSSVKTLGDLLNDGQHQSAASQSRRLSQMEERLQTFSLENEQKLEHMRSMIEQRLTFIQQDNNQRLEKMQEVVDNKLQKTLDEKMAHSFSLVNQRLEQVYKGLGEMQALAVGVGDLKKVLSNVKTRGILGEIQLGAILKEILSPEQYEENIVTKKNSRNPVEFAIKLPGNNKQPVYLPIDSKFPGDTYAAVKNAYESGNKEEISRAIKQLTDTLKKEAKDIKEKYIDPPNTTDFAVLFLPFEGLYAEVVNLGLVEALQNEYKINIAGPSTMAALLNSLQMGFKTLAVQERSTQVWQVLGSVKTEFDKFSDVLLLTQQRLEQANQELDKLVGVRTRQIQRKLKDVSSDSISTEELCSGVPEAVSNAD